MDFNETTRLLPPLSYFEQGNSYSGSKGNHFQFKVFAGESLDAVVWTGEKCLKLTPEEQIRARQSFSMSPEGRLALLDWLEAQYQGV